MVIRFWQKTLKGTVKAPAVDLLKPNTLRDRDMTSTPVFLCGSAPPIYPILDGDGAW